MKYRLTGILKTQKRKILRRTAEKPEPGAYPLRFFVRQGIIAAVAWRQ